MSVTDAVGTRWAARAPGRRGAPEGGATDGAPGSRRPTDRDWTLDAVRGLAVALMVLDHVLIWHPAFGIVRETLTRASMPLFFVLSGHLVRRLTWRHGGILVVGLVLPVVVPWIDSPNVLVWYVIGAMLVVQLRALTGVIGLVFVVGLALTKYANYFDVTQVGNTYQPTALFALMCLGGLLPRQFFAIAARLPRRPFAWIGRYPLSVYVGHLFLIEGFVLMWRA